MLLAIAPVACGGDDGDDEAATTGRAQTEVETGPQKFPAEEQAVRAFIGEKDEERAVQAITCTPEGANATCIATFDDDSCERFRVQSGARLVVQSRGETECPADGETS